MLLVVVVVVVVVVVLVVALVVVVVVVVVVEEDFCCCSGTCHCQVYKNTECCTRVFICLIYVTVNNQIICTSF